MAKRVQGEQEIFRPRPKNKKTHKNSYISRSTIQKAVQNLYAKTTNGHHPKPKKHPKIKADANRQSKHQME